jgi:hypothetical protein
MRLNYEQSSLNIGNSNIYKLTDFQSFTSAKDMVLENERIFLKITSKLNIIFKIRS